VSRVPLSLTPHSFSFFNLNPHREPRRWLVLAHVYPSKIKMALNLKTAVGSQKSAQDLCAPGSLSNIRQIYCGCAGFGQIFRSFSLNSHHYSHQTIETSDSTQHPLVMIANLGQAPRKIKKCLITTEVTTTFFIAPCTPISYTAVLRPTTDSRFMQSPLWRGGGMGMAIKNRYIFLVGKTCFRAE